jgi:K(+)-stimulated pyrophosphate-energized sodium pump
MERALEMALNLTSFERLALWAILGAAVLGLLYAVFLIRYILREPGGDEKMKKIARAIQTGASAYLNRQFRTIAGMIVVLTVLLYLTAMSSGWKIALGRSVAFLLGAVFSGLTGFVGMSMAVRGNVRTAEATKTSLAKALTIAFRTGSITGMFCVGLGLLGATTIFMIFKGSATQVLIGFGFGGSLLALFMRVGGGIFTKAADVGADLVGKIEKNIPEDDPRNPATIADNVGDNVGDCAGMAADIFESYEVTLVASMILGYTAFGKVGVIFPLLVRGVGVLTSIVGTWFVKARSENEFPMAPINRGFWISTVLSAIGFFGFAMWYVHDMRVFWTTLAGLLLGVVISSLTEYYTSLHHQPVKEIAHATQTGPATTILAGIAVGLESSVWAVLTICLAIFASVMISGGDTNFIMYGIALCGMGMLTCTGVIVSEDSYGPVSDNANGICEMAGLGPEARKRIAVLDAVGNTTKAVTKGFAIGSAVIAALALFASYFETVIASAKTSGLSEVMTSINVASPMVFIGLLIGGAVPFLFSSLTIRAVGRAASLMVQEVRRQFREIKGIMEGTAEPEYGKCIDIATKAALKELVGPGLLAILAPLIIGFLLQEEALGGFLAGIILTAQLMAVFLANAGGAWDNAKKSIEDGLYGGKGSEAHKAAVVGDTVGDPFKDTAGPSLNPLIKVMNLVSLLIVPLIFSLKHNWAVKGPIAGAAVLVVVVALWYSRREGEKGVV